MLFSAENTFCKLCIVRVAGIFLETVASDQNRFPLCCPLPYQITIETAAAANEHGSMISSATAFV